MWRDARNSTLIAIAFTFIAVLVFTVWSTHKSPQIRYCCDKGHNCTENTQVNAQNISTVLSANVITLKVIKEKPCESSYEDSDKFETDESGFFVIAQTFCNSREFCMLNEESKLMCSDAECRATKIDVLWILNSVVVPSLLLLGFVFLYFEKVGKKHRLIIWSYLVELVLIHVCIVFIQLYHNGFEAPKFVYEALKYVFYFSVIGCFSWLYMLNDDVWQTLRFYKRSPRVAYDSLFQDSLDKDQKRRFQLYYAFGFGIPSFLTGLACVITNFAMEKVEKQTPRFVWSEKYILDSSAFNFVLLPIGVLIVYGVIRFGQTLLYVRKIMNMPQRPITRERNFVERKRFAVYSRFFFVMLIAWSLFIAFDDFKPYVVSVMNILHIVAFITLFDRRQQENMQDLLQSFSRVGSQSSRHDREDRTENGVSQQPNGVEGVELLTKVQVINPTTN